MMKAPATPFTEDQIQKATAYLRAFEESHLGDPVQGFNNPFRRPGVVASDIAFECGLLKEGETASGRQRVDAPAARRLMKHLIDQGVAESVGVHRTMACGSATKECFALKGFTERLAAAQEEWKAEVARTAAASRPRP